jgi:hypothetical protein
MKKLILILASMTLSIGAMATTVVPKSSKPTFNSSIPARFSSSSETLTYEWGCPVSEVVEAASGADALQKISRECIEEARRAATEKPGVFEVIKVSVIVPDVNVTPHAQGFKLQGTFFLETLVLKGAE